MFGHPLALAIVRIYLAEALLRSGRFEEAREPARSALLFCQALDLGPFLKRILEINAQILAHLDPSDETRIEQLMAKANDLAERCESNWYRIIYLMAWARIDLTLGRPQKALGTLSRTRTLYGEMGLEDGTGEFRSLVDAAKSADALEKMS